jgi:hypothetical protein
MVCKVRELAVLCGPGRLRVDQRLPRVARRVRPAGAMYLNLETVLLNDGDRPETKYLNAPETSIYEKSLVLYGSMSAP